MELFSSPLYDKKNYLVTVDYYSDFFEVDELKDTTSETVVPYTKKNFARHGIPQECLTDGGPQLVSEAYSCLAKDNSKEIPKQKVQLK